MTAKDLYDLLSQMSEEDRRRTEVYGEYWDAFGGKCIDKAETLHLTDRVTRQDKTRQDKTRQDKDRQALVIKLV